MTAPAGATGPEPVRGEPLTLRPISDGPGVFASVVDRYDPRTRRLIVEWPVEHLRLVRLRPGQRLAVELTRPDEGLYRIDGLLESASNEEPPQLTLLLDGQWQRAQRREALRHAIEMRPTAATRFAAAGSRERFDPLVLNLSSGGMRVQSETELTVDDQLEMMFGTPSGRAQLRLRMVVLRVERLVEGGGWTAGCQFVESELAEREQIVAFILAQQRAVARDLSA
jgi:c-di-GMP-binding flagellar brake protein YcgR